MNAGRDFLIALSLSNLWFIRLWYMLLPESLVYPRKGPAALHLIALLVNVLLLGAGLGIGAQLARRCRHPWAVPAARFAMFLMLFLASRLPVTEALVVDGSQWMGQVAILAAFTLLAVAGARRPRAAHATAVLLLILSPFVLVTSVRALLGIATQPKARLADRSTQPSLPAPPDRVRVVWIIFDELDQHLAFEARPQDVLLPHFDQLRSEALYARQAFPPSQSTMTALPALLTGKLVAQSDPTGPDELLLQFHQGSEAVPWSGQPTVFSRARDDMGVNGAIVGWYHPYCRVLAAQLASCYWDEIKDFSFLLPGTLLGRMGAQIATTLEDAARLGELRLEFESITRMVHQHKQQQHRKLMEHAVLVLRNPALGLVLVHLSVPHPPAVYDREKGEYSLSPGRSYLDNLALADRSLGELRQTLEEEKAWDSAAILVTSDHAWRRDVWVRLRDWSKEDAASARSKDYRVPFLLKLPHQTQARVYDQPFNTVLTSELLLAVLREEVRDVGDAEAWLDRHRTIGRSPYMHDPLGRFVP